MISRELFVSCINSMEAQYRLDQHNSALASEIFDVKNAQIQNELFKTTLRLLRHWFPTDNQGHCEIEHYCFVLDFGSASESDYISPYDLYDMLISQDKEGVKKMFSTSTTGISDFTNV